MSKPGTDHPGHGQVACVADGEGSHSSPIQTGQQGIETAHSVASGVADLAPVVVITSRAAGEVLESSTTEERLQPGPKLHPATESSTEDAAPQPIAAVGDIAASQVSTTFVSSTRPQTEVFIMNPRIKTDETCTHASAHTAEAPTHSYQESRNNCFEAETCQRAEDSSRYMTRPHSYVQDRDELGVAVTPVKTVLRSVACVRVGSATVRGYTEQGTAPEVSAQSRAAARAEKAAARVKPKKRVSLAQSEGVTLRRTADLSRQSEHAETPKTHLRGRSGRDMRRVERETRLPPLP
ncbi:hypothetical protein EXIGLDRAFT_692193 [Exidia glandulosa HHB12029]|uniref:Uncharacterized protein n=1 Tax=Exidia glandulosa HHB12029 TaxID=1314781 RepID=A0A166MM27_EXIGL|nr:hypothetical protein EXIGLDRAFT_692193 [Exidia glandulosa HHB12029]